MTGRPIVPGSTPNRLTRSHTTNPYNPVTKHTPNGGAIEQSNYNSHTLDHFDFHGDHRGRDDYKEGISYDARPPAFPEPINTTGQPWGVRLGSMIAPEGFTRASMMNENRENDGNQRPGGKFEPIVEIDEDRLARRVLNDMKTGGAPYEMLESVQGIMNSLSFLSCI